MDVVKTQGQMWRSLFVIFFPVICLLSPPPVSILPSWVLGYLNWKERMYSQPRSEGSFRLPPGGLGTLNHDTFWIILLLSLQTSLPVPVLPCYLVLILAVALNYAPVMSWTLEKSPNLISLLTTTENSVFKSNLHLIYRLIWRGLTSFLSFNKVL